MALTLAIDTATAACSVALLDGGEVVASAHEIVGRGHAERLITMIAELPGGGRADLILVGCGPGSFTGVRVGVAAARGLGLGWGVPVRGFSTLALIAARGFGEDGPVGLAVATAGGHGQLFVESFAGAPMHSRTPLASLTPAGAARVVTETLVVGDGAAVLVAARGWGEAREAIPDARDVRLLSADMTTLPPSPIYGRAPDAKPMR